jgi:hypothetical protein
MCRRLQSDDAMYDLALRMSDRPGELARFGEAMGRAGVSVEGGGVFTVNGEAVAHFLFEDGEAARSAAERAGLEVTAVREVLVRRLKQDQPGQLGAIARALADSGVNIVTQYSDHSNQLILVVDDIARAELATREWAPRP